MGDPIALSVSRCGGCDVAPVARGVSNVSGYDNSVGDLAG
jgi:hypothetical protein